MHKRGVQVVFLGHQFRQVLLWMHYFRTTSVQVRPLQVRSLGIRVFLYKHPREKKTQPFSDEKRKKKEKSNTEINSRVLEMLCRRVKCGFREASPWLSVLPAASAPPASLWLGLHRQLCSPPPQHRYWPYSGDWRCWETKKTEQLGNALGGMNFKKINKVEVVVVSVINALCSWFSKQIVIITSK